MSKKSELPKNVDDQELMLFVIESLRKAFLQAESMKDASDTARNNLSVLTHLIHKDHSSKGLEQKYCDNYICIALRDLINSFRSNI
jgi:hypothetical protein